MITRSTLFGMVACAALTGAVGCSSDGSISGVIPGEVFVGRSADVLVIGDGTAWDGDTTVNFGPGILVNTVTVASETAILANITADASAPLGPRNVSVGDLEFENAFELTSPVQVKEWRGQTAQGSISIVSLQNLDFENPFDTTSTGDGFFTPLVYTNIQVTAGEGVNVQLSSVDDYSLDFFVLTDVDAAAGAHDLEILSGPPDQQVSFRHPAAFEVGAREAVELVGNEPANGSITEPFQSVLYKFEPSSLSIVNAYTFAESPDAAASFALLGPSGSFFELIDVTSTTTFVGEEPYYLIYFDGSGLTGYSYEIGAEVQAADAMPESEPNNDTEQAQPADKLPAVMQDASLPDDADVDWIKVVVTPEDVAAGKVLHVWTYGDDSLTDVVIRVFGPDGKTKIADSGDDGFHEDLTTTPLAQNGVHYIKVVPSPEFFDPAHAGYDLAVVLEDAPAGPVE